MIEPTFVDFAPQLSELDLLEVEKAIGVRLPSELRSHYLRVNGGRPETRRFLVTAAGYEHDVALFLPMRFPSEEGEILLEEVYQDLVLDRGEIPRTLLPFAVNGGDDYFCVVVESGEVSFYAMDHSDEPEVAAKVVAESLSGFLALLITEEEFFARDFLSHDAG